MASVVDICNRALNLIGQSTIADLTEVTPVAQKLNLMWPNLRDSVLRSHPWNCAAERVTLARLGSTPAWGFSFEYQLPTDCLRVVKIDPDANYSVEGRKLRCDQEELDLLYVKRLEDSTQYDSELAEAFSFQLAAELSFSETGSTSLLDYLQTRAIEKLADARSADAREGTPEDPRVSSWLNAKLGKRSLF